MRNKMLNLLLLCFCLGICLDSTAVQAQQPSQQDSLASFTQVGQPMPSFNVTTLDGTAVNIKELRGKVLFINFWATWCGPCRYEMPRLEKEIWQKFKSSDFVMVAIAREQSEKELGAFIKQNPYSFPMASDPQRKIFELFANGGIPRSYVVGRGGAILYQSVGYSPQEFDKMKKILERELKKEK